MIGAVSKSLRELAGGKVLQLLWCIIYSPNLFSRLHKIFSEATNSENFDMRNRICLKAKNGVLEKAGGLEGLAGFSEKVPLLEDGGFKGDDIFVAYIEAIITVVWMKKKIITIVSYFNAGIPQTIFMV